MKANTREMAADALQDAYLAILEKRAVWPGGGSFKAWLFGVIRMTAKAHRRRRAAWFQRFAAEGAAAEAPAPCAADPMTKRMQSALKNLPKRQSEVAILVFAHGLTIEESAHVLNISTGSARTHYARAKTRLADALCDANNLDGVAS